MKEKISSGILEKGTIVEWHHLYDICSALIRFAGKSEHYNADVLYDIEGFVDILNGKKEMPPHYYIGIREMGTDGNAFILSRGNDYPYLAKLELTVEPYLDDRKVTLWQIDKFEMEEKTMDATEKKFLATYLRNSHCWAYKFCKRFCQLAGLEEDFEKADGETFESVVYKAADILGVEI